MPPKVRRFLSSALHSESFPIGILHLIGLIPRPRVVTRRRGRPYIYTPTVILQCFVARIGVRIPSDNALLSFLSNSNLYNARRMTACGLDRVSDMRTFDRRFDAGEIRERLQCYKG